MVDRDRETHEKRQKEFVEMIKEKLGPDIIISEFHPINSYHDDWEVQVEKNGKKASIKFFAELMTDDNNNYEKEFERRLSEIKKSLRE